MRLRNPHDFAVSEHSANVAGNVHRAHTAGVLEERYVGYVLGVDGGNSKTIAVVADRDGSIVGAARGGCTDIYGSFDGFPVEIAESAALATLKDVMDAALGTANLSAGDVEAGGFSLAGADWPEDYRFLHAALLQFGYGGANVVVNDALGPLRAGSPDGTGISVVCGTGNAIGARAPDGRFWHGSHWLESLGGGPALSRSALRAMYRADLGIDPPTALTSRILTLFELEEVESVLHMFSARLGTSRREISRIAPIVLDEAANGDRTALRIVHEHAEKLGEYALAVGRKVGLVTGPQVLVLAGGVFRHSSPLFGEAISRRVREGLPEVRTIVSRVEPVAGAALLGLEAAGVRITDEIIGRVCATLPAAPFVVA
jgi:N-acetylglucosamine kinase-like BadF-type ATPase